MQGHPLEALLPAQEILGFNTLLSNSRPLTLQGTEPRELERELIFPECDETC